MNKIDLSVSNSTEFLYETRCGYPVVIYHTNLESHKPVLGVYEKTIIVNGKQVVKFIPEQWTLDGRKYCDKRIPSELDIIKKIY